MIKNTIDHNSWYNDEYKLIRNYPHALWFFHYFSSFLFVSLYNMIILHLISESSQLHTMSFYITNHVRSYILAILSLYHSRWFSGKSIHCWFRFAAWLQQPQSNTLKIPSIIIKYCYLQPPIRQDHTIYWSAAIYTIISKNLTVTCDSIQYVDQLYYLQ